MRMKREGGGRQTRRIEERQVEKETKPSDLAASPHILDLVSAVKSSLCVSELKSCRLQCWHQTVTMARVAPSSHQRLQARRHTFIQHSESLSPQKCHLP